MTWFMVRMEDNSWRRDASWAAIWSCSESGGWAAGWEVEFSERCSGFRLLVGTEGEAKRSSVSSASLSERERELRSGGLSSFRAIILFEQEEVQYLHGRNGDLLAGVGRRVVDFRGCSTRLGLLSHSPLEAGPTTAF